MDVVGILGVMSNGSLQIRRIDLLEIYDQVLSTEGELCSVLAMEFRVMISMDTIDFRPE